jgi:hypothetical protein
MAKTFRVVVHVHSLVIQRVFRAYADGKSPETIASELNAESIPVPKRWRVTDDGREAEKEG